MSDDIVNRPLKRLSVRLVVASVVGGFVVLLLYEAFNRRTDLNREYSSVRPLLKDEDTLCVLALGQSNAANHGFPAAIAGGNSFSLSTHGWAVLQDPVPGATGTGGSVWTRLAARALVGELAKNVVIGCVAQGSSAAEDWSAGGMHFTKLLAIKRAFRHENLTPDVIVYHQGETESWNRNADPAYYKRQLVRVIDDLLTSYPGVPILVCQTSRDGDGRVNSSIRYAQETICAEYEMVLRGPDTDSLGGEFRHDGIHFNEKGLESFADMLYEQISDVIRTVHMPEIAEQRIKSLDGLRAIAVALVISGHSVEQLGLLDWLPQYARDVVANSSFGVRMFFVLSGYLITKLLLKERKLFGTISMVDFYARRALRIFPGFYAYLIVIVGLASLGFIDVSLPQILAAGTYSWNYGRSGLQTQLRRELVFGAPLDASP